MNNKEQRKANIEKCKKYILKAGDLPAAKKLAKDTGTFSANTSVWVAALGECLLTLFSRRKK